MAGKRRLTEAEQVRAQVESLDSHDQREQVLFWLDDTDHHLHVPQVAFGQELAARAHHNEEVTVTWAELALLVASVRKNSQMR